MFDRLSEQARRVIFFARYEACTLGSASIETEHLLLGLMREDKVLRAKLPAGALDKTHEQIEQRSPPRARISSSLDIPLSDESKRVLAYGAEETENPKRPFIDCGHLVLGLLRVEDCFAADLLRRNGIDLESYRGVVAELPPMQRHVIDWPRRLRKESRSQSLKASIDALEALVVTTRVHLLLYSETDSRQLLKRKPWSRKEALGHLVDCAALHQPWIARALTEPKLIASGYPRDEWVSAQNYSDFSWYDLMDLWTNINRLLVHVLAHIPEDKLQTPCRIGIEDSIPLSKLIARYIEHCQDIAGQILIRG